MPARLQLVDKSRSFLASWNVPVTEKKDGKSEVTEELLIQRIDVRIKPRPLFGSFGEANGSSTFQGVSATREPLQWLPAAHLVIVVHGIGEAVYDPTDAFRELASADGYRHPHSHLLPLSHISLPPPSSLVAPSPPLPPPLPHTPTRARARARTAFCCTHPASIVHTRGCEYTHTNAFK